MAAELKNIPLKGLFPIPPGVETASVQLRAAFWKQVGTAALRLKRKEILAGIDVWGKKLQPVKRTWGDPTPLIPHGEESKTYRLLTLTYSAQGATLYWRSSGSRVSWPTILGYHAYRHGPRSLPVRNEIGLSPRSIQHLTGEAKGIWRGIARKSRWRFESNSRATR
jgi:hypothetical protein